MCVFVRFLSNSAAKSVLCMNVTPTDRRDRIALLFSFTEAVAGAHLAAAAAADEATEAAAAAASDDESEEEDEDDDGSDDDAAGDDEALELAADAQQAAHPFVLRFNEDAIMDALTLLDDSGGLDFAVLHQLLQPLAAVPAVAAADAGIDTTALMLADLLHQHPAVLIRVLANMSSAQKKLTMRVLCAELDLETKVRSNSFSSLFVPRFRCFLAAFPCCSCFSNVLFC